MAAGHDDGGVNAVRSKDPQSSAVPVPLVERLRGHVEALDRVRHPITAPDGLDAARSYLGETLDRLGFRVDLQLVTDQPVNQYNVIARAPGDISPLALVLEAHYDTVPDSRGADDNASGVAGMLEIARLIGPQAGLAFASFCLEEDRLQGAAAFVDSLGWRERPACIDLEMIGYTRPEPLGQRLPIRMAGRRWELPLPYTGQAIAIASNWRSRRLAKALASACAHEGQLAIPLALPGLEWAMPDIRRSDHAFFWRRDLEAVMVTDTANFRNPHYHRPTDIPETLDFPFMSRVVRGTARYLCRQLRDNRSGRSAA